MLPALGNFSAYSFYKAMQTPQQLVRSAADMGYKCVGLSDENGLYGAVIFSQACEAAGIKPVYGCRLHVETLGAVQLTVGNRAGYEALCSFLSTRFCRPESRSDDRRLIDSREFLAWWKQFADHLLLSFPIIDWSAFRKEMASGQGGGHLIQERLSVSLVSPERLAVYVRHWRDRWQAWMTHGIDPNTIWIELGRHNGLEHQVQQRVFQQWREAYDWQNWVIMTGSRLAGNNDRSEKAFRVLQSIGTLSLVDQHHPDKLVEGDYALPLSNQLYQRYKTVPEVLASTRRFAECCSFDYEYGKLYLPSVDFSGTTQHEAIQGRRGHALQGKWKAWSSPEIQRGTLIAPPSSNSKSPSKFNSDGAADDLEQSKSVVDAPSACSSIGKAHSPNRIRSVAGKSDEEPKGKDGSLSRPNGLPGMRTPQPGVPVKARETLPTGEESSKNTRRNRTGLADRRLRYLCLRGLIQRYYREDYPWRGKPSRRDLKARLERELSIVAETGYAGYFLVFYDVVRECRKREIPLLARGSAAGSLICYTLGVSNVCPFRFGLSFERFLNRERLRHSKLPDIDLDLPWDRRDEIILYLFEKYGAGNVAMIGGFSTFKARAAIAEVAKCFGMPDRAARNWTKYLPHGTTGRFLRRRKDYVETRGLRSEERFEEVVKIAEHLDGLPRHPMMHPCGVVIADRPLTVFTPLERSGKGYAMTQMSMDPIEDLGLLKLDLLGQAGLSVIRDCMVNIREERASPREFRKKGDNNKNSDETGEMSSLQVAEKPGEYGGVLTGKKAGMARRAVRMNYPSGGRLGQASLPQFRQSGHLSIAASPSADFNPLAGIDYESPEIYDMFLKGAGRGVFHVESPAMTSLLRLCRCSDIDCLVATVSVIRPGAANEDKKNTFARRHLGLEEPAYLHPELEPILRDTYGLMVYEEHILLVANTFAGMDFGTADLLRRVLVKKSDPGALEELGRVFAVCARNRGRSEEEIETIWKLLADFSGYMFNKAHGAAYAVEAFQGCWLKARWPVHFLAAVLQNERGFYRSLVYVLEALRYGARLVGPDVCNPQDRFWVTANSGGKGEGEENLSLYVPVRMIKGLSAGFLRKWRIAINAETFCGWWDFLERVKPQTADLLVLARAGALRRFFSSRYQAVWEVQALGRVLQRRTKEDPQMGFEARLVCLDGPEREKRELSFPSEDSREMANWECELLGYPVSMSPFDYWLEKIDHMGTMAIAELPEHVDEEVDIHGIVVNRRAHSTAQGKLMKFISIADSTGIADVTFFPSAYREFGYILVRAEALRLRVLVRWDGTKSGVLCECREVTDFGVAGSR